MTILTEEACFRILSSLYPDLEDLSRAECMAVFAREQVDAERERIYQELMKEGIDAESLIFPEQNDKFQEENKHVYRNGYEPE